MAKKLELPEEILIAGHKFIILEQDDSQMPTSQSTQEYKLATIGVHAKFYGEMDPNTCIIRVNTENSDPAIIVETLIHEIFHAIFEFAGIKHDLKRGAEERVVTSFSNHVTSILLNNPEVLKLINAASRAQNRPTRGRDQ